MCDKIIFCRSSCVCLRVCERETRPLSCAKDAALSLQCFPNQSLLGSFPTKKDKDLHESARVVIVNGVLVELLLL